MAAMATTMKNLLSVLSGAKTAGSTPAALAPVATREAHTNSTMNVGSARFKLKPLVEAVSAPFCAACFRSRAETHSANANVMGMMASVRVSLTMVA